jgi:hypothetical protein
MAPFVDWVFTGFSRPLRAFGGGTFLGQDGSQMALASLNLIKHPGLSPGIITQGLEVEESPILFKAGTDYELNVLVGRAETRNHTWGNGTIMIYAGDPNRAVSSLDLGTISPPISFTFTEITLEASAAQVESAGAIGRQIGVFMGQPVQPSGTTQSGTTWFDNVRLYATPAQ